MPETLEGRERIIQYLNENNITIADLAAMYGIAKQDMSDYLSGRKKNPRGNKIILKIISDFKIAVVLPCVRIADLHCECS